jgi:putative ABC transport system ATP-binding protein
MPTTTTPTSPTPASAVLATDLHQVFAGPSGPATVLAGVSLDVAGGEWVALMGPSGSGKSTLLHLLGGLDNPASGEVWVAGERMSGCSESARARLRRHHVGYVFQQYNLVDELDAVGNVELPLRLRGVPRRAARARAGELLGRLGLAGKARSAPSTLSGGQQQRVAIARALAARPTVVLADEPTGALDSGAAGEVVEVLRAAHRDGQAIVVATHDPDVAAAADRVLHLRDGRVVSGAPPGQPVARPAMSRAAGVAW